MKALGRLASALLLSAVLALGIGGSAGGAPLGQISDFQTPTMNSQPEGIVAGPDGNLWFAEFSGNKIAAVNPTTHGIAEFSVPTGMSQPLGVAVGPDGNIWFTEWGANKIGEIDPATHMINQFPIPTPGSNPVAIVAGPDGNMWFTEQTGNKIASINPVTHGFNEIPVTTAASQPFGIAAGPDGNIWFTEKAASKIGVLNLGTHTITEVATPTANAMPNEIAAGPDGNMWFTEMATGVKGIGEAIPGALPVLKEFQTPTPNAQPVVITPGPDGNMWFTEGANPGRVAFINPFTQAFGMEFLTPTTNSGPVGIATGADGNLWFTENATGRIGLVGAGAPPPLVAAPSITGVAQPGGTLTCQPGAFASYAGLQPSTTTFGFDGFRWLSNGSPIGPAAQQRTVTSADVGHQISCRETVTYRLVGTTVIAVSAPVTVAPPLGASVTNTSVSGNTASLTIACRGLASQRCSGRLTAKSRVTARGSRTTAVTARSKGKRKPKRGKTVTRTVTVAAGSYAVGTGHSTTVKLRLNSTGQKLLNRFYRLPATLTIGGTTPMIKSITFSYGRLHISPGFVWVFSSSFSFAAKLTVPHLPPKAKTIVICRGPGCPFARRTFSRPKHGTLNVAPALKHRHLAPHAIVELQITAPNAVTEVVIFTVIANRQPSEAFRCMVPGARRPTACA